MHITDIQLARLRRLEYRILPGKGRGDVREADLHNRAYSYWKAFWTEVYGKQGSLDAFSIDDFSRQDTVGILLDGERIVALHLNTVFQLDLDYVMEHRYFKFYPPEFAEHLRGHPANTAQSIEYLTVDPAWRKSASGVSLGEVMIGCSVRLAVARGYDAVIAVPRADIGVNRMVYAYGLECFRKDVHKRNFVIDIAVGFRERLTPNSDPVIQGLIEHYWNKRIDAYNLTSASQSAERKSA